MCPGASPGEPQQPVPRSLCIGHLGGDTLPHPCWLPDGRPGSSYQTIPCHDSFGLMNHPTPLLRWRICPPCMPLPPQRLIPGLCGYPSDRGPPTWLSVHGSPWPCDTQRLCEDNVGKDERPLGFPTISEYPLPLLIQYGREAAPYCARGSGIPARRLRR